MGGPLSDLLADLIIENKIEKPISIHPKWGPLVDWVRKADDTFLEWRSTHAELNIFHEFLNSLHPRIQWSMEVSTDNQIPFLDILIIKQPHQILTTVYRKPAASNRYIHYSSAHPWKDKVAAMKSLSSRALDYCSPPFLEAEINLLTNIFLQNGYPPHIIHKFIHNEPPPLISKINPTQDPPNPTKSFFAPFHPSANHLFKVLRNKFNIDPIFTSTPSLGTHLFKRRPPTPPMNKPGAIYAIPCECDLFYIGETGRTAAIRTAEEKAACAKVDRTNKLSTNTTNDLGITTHHKETGHSFLFSNTRVLAYETTWHQRKLLEGLFIESNKDKLVNLKSGTRVDNCWTPLLASIPSLATL
jgi:hypothetical protein